MSLTRIALNCVWVASLSWNAWNFFRPIPALVAPEPAVPWAQYFQTDGTIVLRSYHCCAWGRQGCHCGEYTDWEVR